jgi:flavin reductase (DIM6/NTAB) family NADH-FMN oxidoreductase RutF
VAEGARVVAVHLVPADGDALAALFGSQTGDDVDKFERCSWREGPEGVPILDDCPNWFAGRVLDTFDAGDHRGLLLEPIAAGASDDPSQYDFHRAKRLDPGHEP